MDNNRKKQILNLLNLIKDEVADGEEIPLEYSKILFPQEKNEYELTYYHKESEEQIISNALASPLQEDRRFSHPNNNWLNKIIFGDNLQILKELLNLKKKGKLINSDGTAGARLIYIDPPFSSKQDFSNSSTKAYSDKLEGAEFLEWLRKRLILLREIMADDGSIYVHLDWRKSHYVKVLMDEIFGESNFRNEIIWHYGTYVGQTKNNFPRKHDTIFLYGKTQNRIFHPQRDNIPESDANYKRWKSYFNENNEITGANYPKKDTKFSGYIKRFENTNNRKISTSDVLLKVDGKLVDSVWNIKSVNPMAKERVDYPTQKPEELLERIIKASSNPGDLVIDVFGGSGTTAAVSEKLNRRWITADIGKLSVYTIQKRILEIDNYKGFSVYNAGLYDNDRLNKFEDLQWKDFAMSIWNIQKETNSVKGVTFDGISKNGDYVKIYTPSDKDSKITKDTIEELYKRIGQDAGNEIVILAPRGKFAFFEDELDGDGEWDVIFTMIRIPYSLDQRFTENFSTFKQADDNSSVNDAVNAIGFDFIRPPKVQFKVENNQLKITNFKATSMIKGNESYYGFDAFSMVLIDYNYNGETFKFDDVKYKSDFSQESECYSTQINNIKNFDNIMFIFIDKFGNEYKTSKRRQLNGY